MRRSIGVAVIGCGLIGRRRAETAARDERSAVRVVVDTDAARASELAAEYGAEASAEWEAAIGRPDIDLVVVATPNGHLAEIGCAALRQGRHVLIEKPMGRNLAEARMLADAAAASGRVLKIGFNHRYHPALAEVIAGVAGGEIGRVVGVRARYGHGGRLGCEKEWRGDPELAGGGHLLDQGIHVADLIHAVAGLPEQAVAFLHTAVWPLGELEDNAHAMFRLKGGAVAQLHVSMTQWKNLFSFEVFGETGSLAAEGLGGSYGVERLVRTRRRLEGGVPEVDEVEFAGPDHSWEREWDDLMTAVAGGELRHGGVEDGEAAMRMIDALYRSARSGGIVTV